MFRTRRQVTCEMCISKAFRRPCGKNNISGVPRNFARTYADCSEILFSLKQWDSRNIVEKKTAKLLCSDNITKINCSLELLKHGMTYNHLKKLNNHLDNIIIILPRRFSWLIVVDKKMLGGAGGIIAVTYFICVTYCHLACLKRHSIVSEWLLNLLRWLQVIPCSHNYELFAVNDNSKTAKCDMIHGYLCSRPTSVGQDQGSHDTTNVETYCSSLWQNKISHAF